MPDEIDLDYETACDLDLTKVGLDRYSAHPSCRVLMASYSINNGRTRLWEAHREPMPAELEEALSDPDVVKWAFNMQFERTITNRVLGIDMPIHNTRCVQALAYMQSFSGRLEDVGNQMDLPPDLLKLKTGKKLINMFCGPQKVTKSQPYRWRNWDTDPFEWEDFGTYCMGDTETEKAIKRRLIQYPIQESEWELYQLDQEINDFGVPIDLDFVRNGLAMALRRKGELIEQLRELTGLANPNSPVQLTAWLRDRGYPFNDIGKDTVTKVVNEYKEAERAGASYDVEEEAIEALKLRQVAGKTSHTKWQKLLQTIGDDGQLRYMFQFAGAGRTSRWAGRGFQPHNLMRTPKELEHLLEEATEAIRANDYEWLCVLVSEPMTALTGLMRSSIRAPKGYRMRVCDLASIETRTTAWLSSCSRLIEVFAKGLDPYIDFATDLFKKAYADVTKKERQDSKPAVLGCTYRLGGGYLEEGKRTGLWGYAESMGVDFTQEESHRAVGVFRSSYVEIKHLWYALEQAAIDAMRSRGKAVRPIIKIDSKRIPVPVTFEYRKPYLMVRLPSGRYLYYHKPRITKEIRTGRDGSTYEKTVVSYMGKKPNSNVWTRIFTHGGKWTENLVQAIARDILKEGMLRAWRAGFRIFLHVHDEIGALVKVGDKVFTLERLRDLMRKKIDWAEGLLLDAAGYESSFYRKD